MALCGRLEHHSCSHILAKIRCVSCKAGKHASPSCWSSCGRWARSCSGMAPSQRASPWHSWAPSAGNSTPQQDTEGLQLPILLPKIPVVWSQSGSGTYHTHQEGFALFFAIFLAEVLAGTIQWQMGCLWSELRKKHQLSTKFLTEP